MGVYDTYQGNDCFVQLKVMVSYPVPHTFNIGDSTSIADGVYVGYGGVVVIHEGKVLRVDPTLTSTWGDILNPTDIVHPLNPAMSIVDVISPCYKTKEKDPNRKQQDCENY